MAEMCEVRIWKGNGNGKCQYDGVCSCGEGCRIGCNNPAEFDNPSFGKETSVDRWWENMYSYAKRICGSCLKDAQDHAALYAAMYAAEEPEYPMNGLCCR